MHPESWSMRARGNPLRVMRAYFDHARLPAKWKTRSLPSCRLKICPMQDSRSCTGVKTRGGIAAAATEEEGSGGARCRDRAPILTVTIIIFIPILQG